MIARIWHGVTVASKSEEYLDYINKTGAPDYRGKEGNRGVYVLRRIENNQAHFLFISLWESVEAIRKFAGPDIVKASYYLEDEKFLLELEPQVRHYEVLAKP